MMKTESNLVDEMITISKSGEVTVDVEKVSLFIAKRIEAGKKISRVSSDLYTIKRDDEKKEEVLTPSETMKRCITFYLNVVTSDWHSPMVGGIRLSDVKVPAEFEGLFVPRGLVLDSTNKDKYVDLLCNVKVVGAVEGFEESDSIKFWIAIANAKKNQWTPSDKDKKLDELMAVKTLSSELRLAGPSGVERDIMSKNMPICVKHDYLDKDMVEMVTINKAVSEVLQRNFE